MSERAERLYEQARALPPAARTAFVREACRKEPELGDEILSLLEAAEAAETFFSRMRDAVWSGHPRNASAHPAPILSPGHAVGHYRILERIGAGGMGTIYRAHDDRLGREVALKFLPPLEGGDAEEKLLTEARAAAALEHPNVCTIHEIGETEEGLPFIAMALYDGETLKERLRRGPLTPAAAAEVALQLARGLAAAHARGIVHRDVKPGNVMLTQDGGVKLLDFGLAENVDVAAAPSATLQGTVPYMSPEQLRHTSTDHRTDLWSLGVVLYEMLTGERPFSAEDHRALLYAILHEEAAPVTRLRHDVLPRLAGIVGSLLKKEPGDRYPSAQALIADLSAVATSFDAPTPQASRLLPGGRRRRVLITGGAVILLGAGGFTLWRRARSSWLASPVNAGVDARPREGPEGRPPRGVAAGETPDIAAHELYLRGSDPSLLRSDSGVRLGVEYLRQAIAVDSTYAAAHAGLAILYLTLSGRDRPGAPPHHLLALAEGAAMKAAALDDSLAEAHAALAVVRWQKGYDWAAAETGLERAIDLDPTAARYREWLAQLYIQMGRPVEALSLAERALELDPFSPSAHAEVGHALLANGRYVEALARLERVAAVQPPLLRAAPYAAEAYAERGMWSDAVTVLRTRADAGGAIALSLYSYMLARAGRRAEALDVHATLLDRWRQGTSGAFEVAVSYAGLGDLDQAFSWLDRAVDDHSAMRPNVHIMEPVFGEWRLDPRFGRVRQQLGLPGK